MDGASELARALKDQARANVIARRALQQHKSEPNSKYFCYALLLQEGHIYCGSTDNIYQRLLDHFIMSRSSSQWVKLHGPPMRILEVITDADDEAENFLTLSYIAKFGAGAVRGGAWHAVFASEPSRAVDFRPGKLYKALSRAEIDDIEFEIRQNAKMFNQ